MGYDEDLVIPWHSIKKIGVDAIMTDVETDPVRPGSRRRCQ